MPMNQNKQKESQEQSNMTPRIQGGEIQFQNKSSHLAVCGSIYIDIDKSIGLFQNVCIFQSHFVNYVQKRLFGERIVIF